MSWQDEVDELALRQRLARADGRAGGHRAPTRRGKLTVRERIDALADPGSFREFMGLGGDAQYDGARLSGFTPKPSVEGTCTRRRSETDRHGRRLHRSRRVCAAARGGLGQELAANERAREWRIPYVRLLDAAGGSVRSFETIGRTYLPDGNIWSAIDVRTAESRAGRLRRDGFGRGTAGDQRVPRALQSDGERQEPAVSRRTAGRQGGARLRHHARRISAATTST